MITQLMTITPELAKTWLIQNTHNRPIRPARVKQYADDIIRGTWHTTHQGIAFYEDGTLADGQHRLRAIEMAKRAVKMMVTTGLKKEVSISLDAGKPREMADVMHIVNSESWVTKEIVAIARVTINKFDKGGYSLSGYIVEDFLRRHKEVLVKATKMIPTKKRKLTSALVQSAYFCALHAGEPEHMIQRFAQIINNGEIAGTYENAAIRVRELLLNDPDMSKTDLVKRIQRGIYSFCRQTPLHRLSCPENFIYPVPE